MNIYFNLFFRSVVSYFVLVVFARIMGRKQVSQLTFFDYVVGITIGSIASIASIGKLATLSEAIFCIIIWSLCTVLVSEVTLRNIKLRLLIDSEPLLIINNGKVIYKNMKKARYNMGDLLMQLRNKDVFYITDVEIAMLEPDGKLSVLKKSERHTVTAADMNIKKPKAGMMMDIILDGHILSSHLEQIQKNEEWIIQELKMRNINNINDVVFAGIQADEQIYVVTKYDC